MYYMIQRKDTGAYYQGESGPSVSAWGLRESAIRYKNLTQTRRTARKLAKLVGHYQIHASCK